MFEAMKLKRMLTAMIGGLALAVTSALHGQISYLPITDDSNSEISSTKTYTHAIDFGNQPAGGGVATINGVIFANGGAGAFPAIGGTSQTVGTGSTNVPTRHNGDANANTTGGMEDLVHDMIYGNNSAVITLTGLTPGQPYQFRLYHRQWGASGGSNRGQDIGFDTDGVGLDMSGAENTGSFEADDASQPDPSLGSLKQVYALTYEYTLSPGVTALKVYINKHPADTGTYHLYGLTNEVAGPPRLLSLSPADDATGVLLEADLVAKFDERITLKSGGTITITDLSGGSSTTVITLDDPRVSSPNGNDLSINLDGDLQSSTHYSVRISGGAIEDDASTPNAFDGINDDTTWNFTTEPPDTFGPVITATSPADNSTKILPWANLTATFDERIALTGSGTITITDLDNGSSTETITLPDPRVTSPNGDDLRIDLVRSLEFGANYSVRISADAVEDQADNRNGFAGILDDLSWNFTTKAAATQIHNVLLVTIELADALPNRSITQVENKMFSDTTNIDDAFREASFGQMGFHLGDNSGKDPTVHFRYLDTTKAQAGSPAALRDRARADLVAMGYNMSQSNFRFVLYIVPSGFNSNAGTASLGGQWSNYQVFSDQVIMHELGHCLGGNHSNQDPGCALGWATWNYAAEKKIKFGWLDAFPGTVTDVTQNASLTLVPLSRDPAALSGLRVARVADSVDRVFHISYRVSEEPYSKLHDPPTYSQQVFVSADRGATLTSHKATLAAGEFFIEDDLIVTCDSVAPDGLSANVSIGFATYATWIDNFALDPNDQDFTDDPDGDGLANGVEAWFGTHPGRFNAGLANLTTAGTTATFTHPQSGNPRSDLTGYYQWSPNLLDWYLGNGVDGPPGGPTVTISSATIGTTTTVTATPSVASDRIFLRAGVRQ